MQKLLIVESEPEIQSLLKSRFATQFRVEVSTDPNAIRASSPRTNYDLILWHIDGSKNVSGFGELIRDFPSTRRLFY